MKGCKWNSEGLNPIISFPDVAHPGKRLPGIFIPSCR